MQSLFDFQRPLTAYFRRRENAQNSTFTSIKNLGLFECSTSGGQFTNRFGVSGLVAHLPQSVAPALQNFFCPSIAGAGAAECGGGEGVRTPDLRLAKPALCQTELRPPLKRKGWLRGRDLNPRPLGYEPNELPDCSTPRHEPESLGGPG